MDEELKQLISEYVGEQEQPDVVPKPVDVEEPEPDEPPPEDVDVEPIPEEGEVTSEVEAIQEDPGPVNEDQGYGGEDQEPPLEDITSWLGSQSLEEPLNQVDVVMDQEVADPVPEAPMDRESPLEFVSSTLDSEPGVVVDPPPQFGESPLSMDRPNERTLSPVGQFESGTYEPNQGMSEIADEVVEKMSPVIDSKMGGVAYDDDMRYHIDLLSYRGRR